MSKEETKVQANQIFNNFLNQLGNKLNDTISKEIFE